MRKSKMPRKAIYKHSKSWLRIRESRAQSLWKPSPKEGPRRKIFDLVITETESNNLSEICLESMEAVRCHRQSELPCLLVQAPACVFLVLVHASFTIYTLAAMELWSAPQHLSSYCTTSDDLSVGSQPDIWFDRYEACAEWLFCLSFIQDCPSVAQ